MCLYDDAKRTRDRLEQDVKRCSFDLQAFPAGRMGLTPDTVKATPEWQAGSAAFAAAFARLRSFNSSFVRVFANELRRERRMRSTHRER